MRMTAMLVMDMAVIVLIVTMRMVVKRCVSVS